MLHAQWFPCHSRVIGASFRILCLVSLYKFKLYISMTEGRTHWQTYYDSDVPLFLSILKCAFSDTCVRYIFIGLAVRVWEDGSVLNWEAVRTSTTGQDSWVLKFSAMFKVHVFWVTASCRLVKNYRRLHLEVLRSPVLSKKTMYSMRVDGRSCSETSVNNLAVDMKSYSQRLGSSEG
jgi:hypothetical protein